jgi:hypothetical protein
MWFGYSIVVSKKRKPQDLRYERLASNKDGLTMLISIHKREEEVNEKSRQRENPPQLVAFWVRDQQGHQ